MCVIMTEQVISPSHNWMVLLAVLTEVTLKGSCMAAKSKHEVSPHDWLVMLWSVKKRELCLVFFALRLKIIKSFYRMSLKARAW